MNRIRIRFEKKGRARFISHLDLMSVFQRAISRAKLNVKSSDGFNPHTYVSIAIPLSLGYESRCEALDIFMPDFDKDYLIESLNSALPEGIVCYDAYITDEPPKKIAFARYKVTLFGGNSNQYEQILSKNEIIVEKKSKKKIVDVNIAPLIKKVSFENNGENIILDMLLVTNAGETLNPEYVVKALKDDEIKHFVVERAVFFREDMTEF